VRMCVALNII